MQQQPVQQQQSKQKPSGETSEGPQAIPDCIVRDFHIVALAVRRF